MAWAHPTTGVVPHCAPSLAIFVFQQMTGSRPLDERGVVIAATDYPGLGTPGPHPYLVGVSEGRAVLNSVRAARAMPGPMPATALRCGDIRKADRRRCSQGELAKSYAPELDLVGVAAAAPATELAR